ncbi:hypothetical protein BKD09_29655 [Bradyrhizobium japonicum]|uniref:Uncharacterized protein n=1 Tax=Bradyrhizobium japonicum TaxID=375 RepID=A0A1L3FGT1_BRAJP|nr:hypothetical protein BKD09_29655 [Bradyrhizobium japonicum]
MWSQPFRAATYLQRAQVSRYFSEVLIEPNFNFNDEPRLLTTAMIASAMPAAIRPYSIAVAAVSSARKRRMVCMASPEFQRESWRGL